MKILLLIFLSLIVYPIVSSAQADYEEKADKYEELGNHNDAIVYYTLALDGLNGQDRLDIVHKRANCYQHIDNLTSALVDYSEIVDFYRENPNLLKYLSSRSKDDYIDFQFEFMTPLFLKAGCLYLLGRTEDSISELNQYIKLSERNNGGMMYAFALEYRGLCLAEKRDMEGACADWEKAVKEGNESAKKLLADYCR